MTPEAEAGGTQPQPGDTAGAPRSWEGLEGPLPGAWQALCTLRLALVASSPGA